MISLQEMLLFESTNGHILNLNSKNAQQGVIIEDTLKNMLKNYKSEFSITNKTDLEKFYNTFILSLKGKFGHNNSADYVRKILSEFSLGSPYSLSSFLTDNAEKMKEQNYNIEKITNFQLSKAEKAYHSWKNSDEYIEGKEIEDDDTKLERSLIIYDANDPSDESMALEYDFKGKLGKDSEHQVNMCKVDWHYSTGGKYFDARPILASTWMKRKNSGTLDKIKYDSEFSKSLDKLY